MSIYDMLLSNAMLGEGGGGGGGSSDFVTVHAPMDDEFVITMDMTYQEISTALAGGQLLVCLIDYGEGYVGYGAIRDFGFNDVEHLYYLVVYENSGNELSFTATQTTDYPTSISD